MDDCYFITDQLGLTEICKEKNMFVTKSNGKNKDSYNPNDDIYTPEHVAKKIIEQLPIQKNELVLDPFAGGKVFYNNFPDCNKDWCEIKDGKDFFDYQQHVDWIVSNPPYSKFTEVMQHSYEIADNIVYLIPLNKIVSSWGRVVEMSKFGGIVKLWIFPACKANFPFRFPACAVWIKRGYNEPVQYELWRNL